MYNYCSQDQRGKSYRADGIQFLIFVCVLIVTFFSKIYLRFIKSITNNLFTFKKIIAQIKKY